MKIVITDCDHGFFEPERSLVSRVGGALDIHQCSTPADVIRCAAGADALLCQYAPVNREVLSALPQLRVVGRYGVGVDNVDLRAATELGISVVYAPDFCTEEVADHTLALILALTRQLVQLHLRYTQRLDMLVKDFSRRFELLGNVRRSQGRLLGLIGFGRIGKAVAKRASAFGFTVGVHDRFLLSDAIRAHGLESWALDDLLRASDVVSLHCPLSAESRGFIGARELRLVKPSAFLINTARGALVDESALLEALSEGRLAGAALDVTPLEPLPVGHPFLRMEQVILTPHVAFYSAESILQLKKQIAQSVINVLLRRGGFSVANPEVLERKRSRSGKD